MRILLLGANGQVGWELRKTLPPLGELVTASRGSATDRQIDVSDLDGLRRLLDETTPTLIVNAAAYTAVDKAESEPELATRINADVPAALGEWAAANRAMVVHYSTDYVFDGSKSGAYIESDTTNPLNVYGHSKLAGDQALLTSDCLAIILRVSWVYGMRGHNFLLTMRRLMQEREELNIVDDQTGTPTWSRTIAEATADVLRALPSDTATRHRLRGVYHLAPRGSTTWFGFAERIRDAFALDCRLNPIPTSAYPTPAQRPPNSRMDGGKLARTFGIELPDWEDALAACIADKAN